MLTVYGMWMYQPTLFDGVVLPTGMNSEMMVREFIRVSGDLYPYYQVPDRVQQQIADFFQKRKYNYEMMYKALTAVYNPIENYDRTENETETPDITRITHNEGEDNSSSGTDIYAYDSTDPTPSNKVTSGGKSKTNGTETETGTRKREMRVHGNVGITTNQQMVSAEIQLREYDLYHQIARDLETEICLQVY